MGSPPSEQTNASLLGRVGEVPCDQAAWDAFVAYYGPKIRGWCRRRGLQSADADDLTQDVIPDAETLRVVQSLTRVLMATKNLRGGFGYKSDGVKLGDAGKVVFWYRREGATHYRALYGDLHAADVTEDKLPEKPKP